MSQKRTTIFYSIPVKYFKGEYYCGGGFGRYFIKLAKKYDKVFLCAPLIELNYEPNDYKLPKGNWEIQPLPGYTSYISSFKHYPKVLMLLRSYSKEWKKLYIRFPAPFSLSAAVLAKIKKVKFIFHVVGDTSVIVKKGTKYSGLMKYLADSYCYFHDYSIKVLIYLSSGTLFNGSGMRRLYDHRNLKIKEVRTSTFEENEIYYRRDSKFKDIIFVGYLRHEKGVDILINALANLSNEYFLTIIGDGPEKEKLEKMVNDNSYIKDRVIFKGHVPLGEELFKSYRKSDLFVLPSVSEGTPRVLVEAMAFGNIVVASDTGGIPYTVNDSVNGLLFKVGSVDELVEKILILEKDSELRDRLRESGYRLAEVNTLESHADDVYKFIEEKCSE